MDRLSYEAGDRHIEPQLGIDLVDLAGKVEEPTTGQVAYLVDMAKADALELRGEPTIAVELVDRHV